MNIAVGSAFRNSAAGVPFYLDQVAALRDAMFPNSIRVIAVEGDSKDKTREKLIIESAKRNLLLDLRTCNHGGPVYGSTESPDRMKALSKVGNAIFEGVQDYDDVLVYVESDLIWSTFVIRQLIQRVQTFQGPHIIAPLIFAGEHFYDVWGFRKNGSRFAPFPPYHSDLGPGLNEVDSVGSCLVIRGNIARTVRIENDMCLVGWCESARAKGHRIYVDSSMSVRHPA